MEHIRPVIMVVLKSSLGGICIEVRGLRPPYPKEHLDMIFAEYFFYFRYPKMTGIRTSPLIKMNSAFKRHQPSRLRKFELPDYDDCKVLPKRGGVDRYVLEFHFYGHVVRTQNEDAYLYDLELLPEWANIQPKEGENDLYIQTLKDTEWHLN